MDDARADNDREDVPRRGRPREVFLIATSAALLTAMIFVARWGYVWFVRQEVVGVSRDVAWFAPAATLMIWLTVAIPIALLAPFVPRRWVLWSCGFGFFAMTALSALLPVSALARAAVGVLSLGLGATAARFVVEKRYALRSLGRLAVASASLLALAGVAIAIGGQRASGRSVSRAPAGAPNVLLIVMDAARADAFGVLGSARRTTPHLDAIAREGSYFTHAIATASWTRPSHRTMFTGKYPIRPAGARSTFLARATHDTTPMLAEFFRKHGYETGAFVANFYYTGWDAGFTRGFQSYRDFPRTVEQVLRSSTLGQTAFARSLYRADSLADLWRAVLANDLTVPARPANAEKAAPTLTDEFLDWRARASSRPFFAFMNYYDAHRPYDPPPPYDRMFSGGSEERDKYDGSIAYIDAEIGRLLAQLRARGELDRTLVVITSDHGELFGEHGLYEHTSNLYYKLLHVPLLVRWPGHVPAGGRVDPEVSLRDLAATISSLALPNDSAPFAGTSLAPLWSGGSVRGSAPLSLVEQGVRRDSTLPFALGDMVSLTDSAWHFVRNNGTGREQLFRYRDDPAELADHAADPDADPILAAMRRRIQTLLTASPLRATAGKAETGGTRAARTDSVGTREGAPPGRSP
ncbi:MAG: sulfatase [Gemmatimonadota bacterium]